MTGISGLADWFRRLFVEKQFYTASWTEQHTSRRAFTVDERAAIERAFAKFDEAFRELDTAFKGWRA